MAQTTSIPPSSALLLWDAVRAEWIKLWSLRSSVVLCLGAVLLMGAATYQVAVNYAGLSGEQTIAASRPAISAVVVVVLVVVSLAMTMVTSEYATDSIYATLLWVPTRSRVVAAKAIVTTVVAFGLGLVLSAVGTGVAIATLAVPSPVHLHELAHDATMIATYLALASLITLGLALIIRSAVGTLTASALLLLGVPTALGDYFTPGGAGLTFLTGGSTELGVVGSLLLFLGWVVAALGAGTAMLVSRDT